MNEYKNMHENMHKLYDKFTSYSSLIFGRIDKFFNDLGIALDSEELKLNQIWFDYQIQTLRIFDCQSPIIVLGLFYIKEDETYYRNKSDETHKKLYLSKSFELWCHLVFNVLLILEKHEHGFFQCKYKIFSPLVCIINALYDVYFIDRNYKRVKYFISKIDQCEKFIEIDYKRHRREVLKEKIKNICKEEI